MATCAGISRETPLGGDELAAFHLVPRQDSHYYHLFAAPVAVVRLPPGPDGVAYQLLTLLTPEGDEVQATLPRFDPELAGQLCDAVLVTHPDPWGRSRAHAHVLKLEVAAAHTVAFANLLETFA